MVGTDQAPGDPAAECIHSGSDYGNGIPVTLSRRADLKNRCSRDTPSRRSKKGSINAQ
jgi:hypothetical protein